MSKRFVMTSRQYCRPELTFPYREIADDVLLHSNGALKRFYCNECAGYHLFPADAPKPYRWELP